MKELFDKIPFENIHRSWVTTLVGIFIILASLASIFMKIASWEEAWIGLVIGILLGFVNEKKQGPPTGLIMFAVLGFFFTSCTLRHIHKQPIPGTTITVHDTFVKTVTIVTKDTSVSTKSASVKTLFNPCDSLTGRIKDLELERINSKAHLKIRKVGNQLEASCSCDSENLIIKKQIEKINTLEQKSNVQDKVITLHEKYIPWYFRFRYLLLICLTCWGLGYFKIHKYLISLLKLIIK